MPAILKTRTVGFLGSAGYAGSIGYTGSYDGNANFSGYTGSTAPSVKTSPLENREIDWNFIALNNIKLDYNGSGAALTALNANNISTGTLAVARGGTGQSSFTNGELLIGNTTGNTLTKATLTPGTNIAITNGTGTISIATSATPSFTSLTVSGDTTLTGDVAVNGGDITTTATTLNLVNANATTVNFAAGSSAALNIGNATGNLTLRPATVVGTQTSQALYNTVATTLNIGGAAATLNIGATTGTLTIGNPTVVGTQTSQALYNTVATTLNFAGAATTLTIGATSGTATIRNATVAVTNALTVGSSLTVGTTLGVTGATTLAGATLSGDLAVNGGDITTSATTFNLVNATATTLNIGGGATTLAIGATSGSTSIRNNLTLAQGTTTLAPLTLTSGTNLTTAAQGVVEFDGVNQYFTPNTVHGRNVIPLLQQFVLSVNGTALTGTGVTTNTYFGANSAATLDAATTYEIECYCILLKTTAGTLTWVPTFSTATTSAHAVLEYTPIAGFTTTTITGAMLLSEATNTAVTALTFLATGSLATATNHVHKIKMFVRTNTACNFRLNVLQSAGTTTPLAGSFMNIRRITTTVGNFVA